MIKRIHQILKGRKLIQTWIKSGGMLVPITHAYGRTVACINCPHNRRGGLLDGLARFISGLIRLPPRHVSPLLLTCQVCGCVLRLKVQMPLNSIVVNSTTEELSKFPAHCWIQKEINA